MIRTNQLVRWFATEEESVLRTGGICGVTIFVSDIGRSVAFYTHVFGMRVMQNRQPSRQSATLTGPRDARLVLRAYDGGALRPVPLHARWGFLVDDLDHVREAAWDSGVVIARDSGEPDHIFRWTNGRSLCVSDPDGNEIELIEGCRPTASPLPLLRRCPARAAWRRWRRPECSAAR